MEQKTKNEITAVVYLMNIGVLTAIWAFTFYAGFIDPYNNPAIMNLIPGSYTFLLGQMSSLLLIGVTWANSIMITTYIKTINKMT